MKKIILILLILNTTAANLFAETLLDNLDDRSLTDEIVVEKDITSNDVVEKDIIIEKNEKETDVIGKDTLEKTEIDSDAAEKDALGKNETENDVIEKTSQEDTLSNKISEINSMQDDEQKVKEWAKFNSEKNYVIINKKDCSATVYDTGGSEIESFEVGIGKEIGDDFNDTRGLLGKPKNTTPAGEFTLITNIYNKTAYGDLTLSLGSKANKSKTVKKMVALHKVPKFREKDRLKKFYDGNLSNNRMSHGCINFLEKDFKELTKYIRGGLKLYVLPEEAGNELRLTKNDKNKYELTQTKY